MIIDHPRKHDIFSLRKEPDYTWISLLLFSRTYCNYLGAHRGRYTLLAQENCLALLNIQVYTTYPLRLLYTFRNVPAIPVVKRD